MEKVYVALFTCCVSRALNLDLTESLDTRAFIRCLRKCMSTRGIPSIVSDNAKTCKASANILKRLYDDPEVKAYSEKNRIVWRFNLERAPWWGVFERLVGSVKSCLMKVLGKAKLTLDELLTTLLEIEATLNSRRLTYEYDEVGSEMLTPSHLIFGRRLLSIPDETGGYEETVKSGGLKRFRILAQKKIHFWNRWRREYMTDLREHHKGKKGEEWKKVEVGDVVLVHEDNVKRNNWKLAKVEDQFTRVDQFRSYTH